MKNYGNATKHLILGIFIVFSAYVMARFLCCLRIDIWLLPVGNMAVMFIIEAVQSRKPEGHRYDMVDFWHSAWDFAMGCIGGWIMYCLVMLIK